MTFRVFAYGSNMDFPDLKKWFKANDFARAKILNSEVAQLPDFKLIWNYYTRSRQGGAANITEDKTGCVVHGLLLTVNEEAFKGLDVKEGHPHTYSRGKEMRLLKLVNGAEAEAWVYKVIPAKCKSTPQYPRREYLNFLINAAKLNNFPKEFLAELEAIPTID